MRIKTLTLKYLLSSMKKLPKNSLLQQKSFKDQPSLDFQQYQYSKTKSKKPVTIKQVPQKNQSFIETLMIIKKYREKHQAPIDTMGCQRLFDEKDSQLTKKYQILMALLLSVQTKDEITSETILKLKQQGILTPQIISKWEPDDIEPKIKKVNFHKKKAKNMIQIAKIFLKSGPPKSLQELLDYPGVGIKISTLYFKVAQGVINGIGVDTHVHRICNRLGWVKTDSPQKTEQCLQKLFDKMYWNEINEILVGFGQVLCNAKQPKCYECPVKQICKYKQKNLKEKH